MNTRAFKTFASTTFNLTLGLVFLLVLPVTSHASQPIEINSCTTITASGDYKLVADLTAPGDCITVDASKVDLDLNGHSLTGPGQGSNASGILIVNETKVDIKGPGVVTNFSFGINFEGVDHSEVKGVTATGNRFGFIVNRDFATPDLNNLSEHNWFRDNTVTGNNQHGFTLNGASNNNLVGNVASNNGVFGIFLFDGTGNQIKANTTNGNGADGIRAGQGISTEHTIKDNTANGNGLSGIRLLSGSTGNSVKGNTAQSNNATDLVDDNSACDNNTWMHNVFNIANQACIQ
jgi:parallel beta-helix repeat protein